MQLIEQRGNQYFDEYGNDITSGALAKDPELGTIRTRRCANCSRLVRRERVCKCKGAN